MSQSQERRDRALQPITASVKIECHMETALSPRGGGGRGRRGGTGPWRLRIPCHRVGTCYGRPQKALERLQKENHVIWLMIRKGLPSTDKKDESGKHEEGKTQDQEIT